MQMSKEFEAEVADAWETISNFPNKFHRDALKWWNTEADVRVKSAIVSATYYETLSHSVDQDLTSILQSEDGD